MKGNFYSAADFFEDGANFRILESCFGDCPLHYHDFVEFTYVLSGKAIHIIEGVSYSIRKGDLYIINTHTPHEIAPAPGSEERFAVLNCLFKPDFLDHALTGGDDFVATAHQFFFEHLTGDRVGPPYIQILGGKPFQFEPIIQDMYSEYLIKADGYTAIIKSYLTALIVKIFRAYQAEHTENQTLSAVRNQMVENVAEYVRQHYMDNLTLEELAGRAYLSPAYFSKIFKDSTGMTLSRFIRSRRIEAACKLLAGGQGTVTEVAQAVGYQDLSSFYEAFRKCTGMSPRRYRTQSCKGDDRPAAIKK